MSYDNVDEDRDTSRLSQGDKEVTDLKKSQYNLSPANRTNGSEFDKDEKEI